MEASWEKTAEERNYLMAKILICLSNSIKANDEFQIPCFYEQLIESLKNCGNNILVFIPNYFNKNCYASENELRRDVSENELRTSIKDFNPDLVITFNNATYSKLLEITDCKIIIWNADTESFWNQIETVKKNKDRYVLFSFSKSYIEDLKKFLDFGNDQCFAVYQATNLKNLSIEKDKNISFIGTPFGTREEIRNIIKKFCANNDLIRVIEKIHQNPFIKKEELIKEISDIDFISEFEKIHEMYYRDFYSAFDRYYVLMSVCELGLHLYGPEHWNCFDPFLTILSAYFHNEVIFSAKQNEIIYNQSKLCLNVIHPQSALGMPWRVPDVMASSGVLVSSYLPFVKKQFYQYVDIPMFDNIYDCRQLCQRLLKDEKWRADIVAGSNAAVEAEWRWEKRFKQMEEILGIPLFNSGYCGSVSVLKPVIKSKETRLRRRFGFRNKIRYKIWKHLGKQLNKKGII